MGNTQVINKGILKADLDGIMDGALSAVMCAMAKHGGMFEEPLPEGAGGDKNDEVYIHLIAARDSLNAALGIYHARHNNES